MDERAGDRACPDRTPGGAEVPGCGTGPIGRLRFVATELAGLWRELRGHRDGGPDQGGPDNGEERK